TLFTSGSTGRPKGVTVSHEAVVNRLRWGLDELPIGADDLVVLKTPYTFDVSVPELFAPLMQGSRLLIADPEGHLDPLYLADLMADKGATMVHFVPSMLSVFLELAGSDRLGRLDRLRVISASGEALPPAVAADARAVVPNAMLYNLFGPTEAAVEITYQRLGEVGDTVPIGVPVWNTVTYVLDERLNRVPDGVPGELYVGGVQLARGYAARADLTAERFVADPFGAPGARMYRMGDLVRRNASGELEYLGRTDFQVKLRGQRIELGEIEAAIMKTPGVTHAAAAVVESSGGQHLVGYFAPSGVDLDTVRESVGAALPAYMHPSVWVPLESMPLNTAGKVDRKALPAPVIESAGYEAPSSEAEERVASVFATLLDLEQVSVTESFFDLGGNSLSALRLAARISDALGVQVSVRDVFDAPSVRELVNAVSGQAPALPPVRPVTPRPERVPLSYSQQRMWFINQMEPDLPTYNIPALFELSGNIDVDLLRTALVDVITRHEILRTTFPAADGLPYQHVLLPAEVDEHLDWRVVTSADGFASDLRRGFDVSHELPIRARVLFTSSD
ncbi:AMP-binding protein, partial [Gordonia paraffinivorans]|uniref:AMP-binding protein n=1 Tax=Gordonia paraffinivorans TaxID=175628 RepID=UPI00242A854D